MSDQLRVEQSDAVLRVQIDAGKGNLFTPEMAAELTAMLQAPPDGAHVVHLSASGPEFCVGRAPFRSGPGPLSQDVAGLVALNRALADSPAVTVTEIQGDAAGFGAGLVAHSDVSIASPRARFSFPEVHAGFAPALVLAWLAPMVGHRKAFWLTATGVQISASEALDLGLITHLVDEPAELTPFVSRCIETLTSKPPEVHREIKRLMRDYAALPDGARDDVAADRLILGALRRAANG
jgi:enoyl-CoA hydratase/carnithine racemase